jgi:hypothetical protein
MVGALAGWGTRHGVVSLHYDIRNGGGFPDTLTFELARVNGELVANIHSNGYAAASDINLRGAAAEQRLVDAGVWLDFPAYLRRA